MNEREATNHVLDAIEGLGLSYMIVGSLASNTYGVPRATQDADVVVQLQTDSIALLTERLKDVLSLDPQASFETVTGTTRFEIQVPEPPFTIEVFALTDDPFDQARFCRRVTATVEGRRRSISTAEDVIIQKLRWSQRGRRHKDLDDARNVIAVQGQKLDWTTIRTWCAQHGTTDLLGQVIESIPPI